MLTLLPLIEQIFALAVQYGPELAQDAELVVSLLDCYVKVNVSDLAQMVLERLSKSCSMAITLPPPVDSVDWLDSLKPGTLHAGYIWLGDTTLNQILVDRGIATALPS